MIGTIVGTRVGLRVGTAIGNAGAGGGTKQIVALLGQSNIPGRAQAAGVTIRAGYTNPYPAIQYKHRQDLTTDDPLIWRDYGITALGPRVPADPDGSDMGIALSLGRYLDSIAPGKFAIVESGIGGAGLDAHLKKTAVYPTTGPNAFSQNVQYLKDAEVQLGGRIAAFVWVQGETDAMGANNTVALAYQANLTQLIADLRSANGSAWANVPFVFNRLDKNNTGGWATDLRASQVAVNAAAISGVTMTTNDDLALNGGEHFLSDGYVLVGERLAMAVCESLGYTKTVTVDATSHVPLPGNRLEWKKHIAANSLAIGLPWDVVNCQEAGGNLIGVHGWAQGVAAGTPLYQQALTGWATKGVGFVDGTSGQRFRFTSDFPTEGTESVFVLVMAAVTAQPAATRDIIGLGALGHDTTIRVLVGTSSPKMQIQAGSAITGADNGGFALRPRSVKIDKTALAQCYYSDAEKLVPTYGTPSGSEFDVGASTGAGTAPTATALQIVIWRGAAAELMTDANVKALYQSLTYTPPWS